MEPKHDSKTPATITVDLSLSYSIDVLPVRTEVFLNILNLFDRKNVVNVYPATGHPERDSWFESPFSGYWRDVPGYTEFYTALNLRNRWAYSLSTGNDVYGPPRQIRFGVKVGL